eukprot:m51a1_g12950 hypothetical protein (252) ;mRNA; f:185-1363
MNAKIVVFLAAAAAVASGARVYTSPGAGSDNVIPVSNGFATLTTTVEGAADINSVQCFAWYGNLPATDDGHVSSDVWDPVLSMVQTRDGMSNTFSAQIPLTVGHVLRATSYCIVDGQRLWVAGNANFRIPSEQQHPFVSISFPAEYGTPSGHSSVPASSGVFTLSFGARYRSPNPIASSMCVARFGYPARFGAPWPTVNETLLHQATASSADVWYGSVPLPAAGGLLEVTARCVYNGFESWLGANYQVQAY